MDKRKKRILIIGILSEIILAALVVVGIIIFIKEPNINVKILSALVAVYGLFQIIFLIPSYFFKNI